MIWLKILGGLMILGLIVQLLKLRRLSLNDMKKLLSMREDERVWFARQRLFVLVAGAGTKSDYWFNRLGGQSLYFPHDNEYINKYNQGILQNIALKGWSIEEAQATGHPMAQFAEPVKKDFVSYRLKPSAANRLLKEAEKSGFQQRDFDAVDKEKEGLSDFSLPGGYAYYTDGTFGIIYRRIPNMNSKDITISMVRKELGCDFAKIV